MANALAEATSPYLLQHKDNPVDWREWSENALADARAADKPILLSVGYAACHWCHVMAHESFEQPAVAELMNRHFVSIKVDREERPDLDAIYQQALALLGQQGGWPLTMFLTPDGEPFWGGTYFPPEQRYGRPGFPQVLEQIAALWRDKRERVVENRDQLVNALRRLAGTEPGTALTAGEALDAAHLIGEQMDTIHGGLGGAPKFPQAPILDFLWQACRSRGDTLVRTRLLHTLRRLCQGGIYDHLGGGFARYAVDAYWLVPHFEKMLYDNAQLLPLLGSAHSLTGEPLFRARCEETVAWLEREMLVEGAFASSLDADSEGEEGRYYVWDAAEIDMALGTEADAFKLAYGVTGSGNFEGGNVLNRLHEQGLPDAAEAELLARCRAALLERRSHRVPPARDDKVLADWNGLMIAGLAEAAGYLDRADWLERAIGAFAAVRTKLGVNDRLFHAWREGRRQEFAFLDDYAQMSRAALVLFQMTEEETYLDVAKLWLARAKEDFGAEGAWFTTAHDAPEFIVRPVATHDGPLPSANGTIAWCLATLWHLTGDEDARAQADAILAGLAGEARRNPAAIPSLLSAALLLEQAVQLVVVGEPGDAGFTALSRAARAAPVPNRVVQIVDLDAALPTSHPAHAKQAAAERDAAYLCIGPVCEAPIIEPERLSERARELAMGGLGA